MINTITIHAKELLIGDIIVENAFASKPKFNLVKKIETDHLYHLHINGSDCYHFQDQVDIQMGRLR